MAEIIIKNDSGDKDFFTIIPNYIANHSTANDQSLYFQMKRYAGEDGNCFATEKTLMSKMGIGKKSYNKSLNYLLSKGWISFVGFTQGKTRPIKTYKINNIWKLNNEYKKEISSKRTLSSDEEISAESEGDKFQKQHKISAESTIEEEQRKEEHKEDTPKGVGNPVSYGDPEINKITVFLKEKLGGSLDGTIKSNRQYANLLLKRTKKDYPDKDASDIVCRIIDIAMQDQFHSKNSTNFRYIFYNFQKILQSFKGKKNNIVAI